MPLNLKKHRKWLIAGTALLLTATPGFALFGLGDIVFDPTSYASLVSQLTTLETQYKMLKNNITHFSLKQQWQTTLHTLENANVANMFGETRGHQDCAQYQLTVHFGHGMEDSHGFDEQQHKQLPARAVSWQFPHVAARHDRNRGLDLSRLPHRRGPVPEQQDRECHGQFLAALGSIRQHRQPPTAKSSNSIF